jgi:hypothetical protein
MKITVKLFTIGKVTNVTLFNVPFCKNISHDEIEDLEINLTEVIKKLQDYRLLQICGE